MAAFPEILAGRLPHRVFRGLLGVHSRYGLHTRQVTNMTLCTERFSRFVTSTTAQVATGWSESCRTGIAPAEKPCLRTAHKIVYAKILEVAEWMAIRIRVKKERAKYLGVPVGGIMRL